MKTSKRRGGQRWFYRVIALLLPALYGYWAAVRPLPLIIPPSASTPLTIQTTSPKLIWPTAGQSAIGIVGSSVLETNGTQRPVPIASTAKVITALTVLHVKPLALGQQGPTITLTANDAALYNTYAAQDGSLVPVQAGEQISEYQMLVAMMLPSANNMADSLAVWAFGSLPAYTAFANNYVQQLGLTETHIGSDASGFLPTTTSTAQDLVRVGELAMQNPALAQIVGQTTANGLPVVGTVRNLNSLLGTANIIGVKTGNTNEAGGVFISASRIIENKKPVIIVTAVVGATSLAQALHNSLPLVESAQTNFQLITIIRAGSVVGHYPLPWGGQISAIASQDLKMEAWGGSVVPATIKLTTLSSAARVGQRVGIVSASTAVPAGHDSVPITLQATPTTPSLWWRLLHPF